MISKSKDSIKRRLTLNTATVIILMLCLCVTTYALVSSVFVKNNIFSTGTVDIEISELSDISHVSGNDGTKMYDSLRMEPGMTIEKSFTVTNNSSCDIWYKLCFKEVKGDLAKLLDVTIKNSSDNSVLYKGKAFDMTPDKEKAANEKWLTPSTDADKTKNYTITFHFPKDSGNEWGTKEMEFSLAVSAVQAKNNPNAEF